MDHRIVWIVTTGSVNTAEGSRTITMMDELGGTGSSWGHMSMMHTMATPCTAPGKSQHSEGNSIPTAPSPPLARGRGELWENTWFCTVLGQRHKIFSPSAASSGC